MWFSNRGALMKADRTKEQNSPQKIQNTKQKTKAGKCPIKYNRKQNQKLQVQKNPKTATDQEDTDRTREHNRQTDRQLNRGHLHEHNIQFFALSPKKTIFQLSCLHDKWRRTFHYHSRLHAAVLAPINVMGHALFKRYGGIHFLFKLQ